MRRNIGESDAFKGVAGRRTLARCNVAITINQTTIMYLDKTKKEEIFTEYGQGTTDTGSAESQIALFTYRIKHLTEHVKQHRKDFVTTRSLTMLVGKRRALLDYLYDIDIERYRAITKKLGLRK